MIEATAEKNKNAVPATSELVQPHIISGGNTKTAFLPEDTVRMRDILSQFSCSDLMAPKWTISLNSSHRTYSVVFPKTQRDNDAILLRAMALQRLAYASPVVSRTLKDAEWILQYFSLWGTSIEKCRTSTVDSIIAELDSDKSLTNIHRNSIMSTLGNMVETCQIYDVATGIGVVDCEYRWKEKQNHSRAPDACVIEQLDSLFFDPMVEIPNQYRTVYMLLRLISNRVNEVLSMSLDCIFYPDTDVYSISIPVQKTTPNHVPEYHNYPKLLSGREENYLYQCLCKQQEFAKSKQGQLKIQHQDYLFVSPTGKTLVKIADVNAFLKEICAQYNVKNAKGRKTRITSHNLRHTAVVERLRYGIISPHQTMRECNHTSISQTTGYSYASEHDETERLSGIMKRKLNDRIESTDEVQTAVEPHSVTYNKYLNMFNASSTRILLDGSICKNKDCTPQIDLCSECEFFHVDPIYTDQIRETTELLRRKMEKLISCKGNPDAIKFIEHQLDVYGRMQDKLSQYGNMLKE